MICIPPPGTEPGTLHVFRRGDEVLLGKWSGCDFRGPTPYGTTWAATDSALEQNGWHLVGPAPDLPRVPQTAGEIARDTLASIGSTATEVHPHSDIGMLVAGLRRIAEMEPQS